MAKELGIKLTAKDLGGLKRDITKALKDAIKDVFTPAIENHISKTIAKAARDGLKGGSKQFLDDTRVGGRGGIGRFLSEGTPTRDLVERQKERAREEQQIQKTADQWRISQNREILKTTRQYRKSILRDMSEAEVRQTDAYTDIGKVDIAREKRRGEVSRLMMQDQGPDENYWKDFSREYGRPGPGIPMNTAGKGGGLGLAGLGMLAKASGVGAALYGAYKMAKIPFSYAANAYGDYRAELPSYIQLARRGGVGKVTSETSYSRDIEGLLGKGAGALVDPSQSTQIAGNLLELTGRLRSFDSPKGVMTGYGTGPGGEPDVKTPVFDEVLKYIKKAGVDVSPLAGVLAQSGTFKPEEIAKKMSNILGEANATHIEDKLGKGRLGEYWRTTAEAMQGLSKQLPGADVGGIGSAMAQFAGGPMAPAHAATLAGRVSEMLQDVQGGPEGITQLSAISKATGLRGLELYTAIKSGALQMDPSVLREKLEDVEAGLQKKDLSAKDKDDLLLYKARLQKHLGWAEKGQDLETKLPGLISELFSGSGTTMSILGMEAVLGKGGVFGGLNTLLNKIGVVPKKGTAVTDADLPEADIGETLLGKTLEQSYLKQISTITLGNTMQGFAMILSEAATAINTLVADFGNNMGTGAVPGE